MANEYSMLYGVDENGYVKTGLQGQVYKNKEDIELLSNKIETAISNEVTKDYVDGQLGLLDAKVDTKLTKAVPSVSGDYLYTTTGIDGTQGTIKYSQTATANQIAQYGSSGNLQTATPTTTAHAANKGYVDQQISNVSNTISQLDKLEWFAQGDEFIETTHMFQTVYALNGTTVKIDPGLFNNSFLCLFIAVKNLTGSGTITPSTLFTTTATNVHYICDANIPYNSSTKSGQVPVFLLTFFKSGNQKNLTIKPLSIFA